MLDEQHGLVQSLVDILNERLAPNFTFRLQNEPRNRVNHVILDAYQSFDGVVAFGNPVFFNDVKGSKYLWTKSLFTDCNLVISNSRNAVDYVDERSLQGKRFAGVGGHRYVVVDDMAKKGSLVREDAASELSNLRKIAAHHADFTVVPYSIYGYYANAAEWAGQLNVAAKPLSCFSRHLFVGKQDAQLRDALNTVVEGLATNADWAAALALHHLDPAILSKSPWPAPDTRPGGEPDRAP
jgi:polar amino acid transport system substrate-binding protein